MKLNLENKIYESNTVLEGHDAKINPEQLKKLWEMLANPYKDNISSIVREITSNCFDSHKEAGVDDAVVITLDSDESGVFIKFSDVGTGLSPERIEKIYINYLTSSKEDSNDFIGAFGIGSKSPLSYTDMFYIDTVYEGIKYSYIMRKGDTAPRIDKIFEMPIKARNGTDIKIYIKSQNASGSDNLYMGDIGSFVVGIRHQLAYFDNVYVQIGEKLGYLNKLPPIVKDINEFTIYEGEHYIYRTNGNAFLNICLGKVNYPIDYSIVFPELSHKINLPIGLKFNIGDLMVTYSREDIKYTQEVVDKIREKFKLAVSEIIGKLKKQHTSSLEYTDIFAYQNSRKDFAATYFYLKLSDNHSLNVAPFINESFHFEKNQQYDYAERNHLVENISYHLRDYNKSDLLLTARIPSLIKYIDSFTLDIPYFSPFKDYIFDIKVTSNYHNFDIIKRKGRHNVMFNGGTKKSNQRYYSKNLISDFVNTPDKHFFIDYDFKDSGYIFGKKFTLYLDKVLQKDKVDVYVSKYEKSLNGYKQVLANIPEIYKDKSKWRDFIVLIQKHIEEPILKRMTSLKSIDSKATQEWYNKYKKDNGLIAPKVVVKKDASSIHYKTFTNYNHNLSRVGEYLNTVQHTNGYTSIFAEKKITELVGINHHVYFTKEDLSKMFTIMNLLKKKQILTRQKMSPTFCMVSKTNEKILITNKLMYTLDDYINDNKEDLIKLYFYTKHITNSSIIDIKNYTNKIGNEESYNRALVIYYLMGNDLLTSILKKDQTIKNIVNTYDAFQGQQYKITDVHDLYKKLIGEVFTNAKIDFNKECKLMEQKSLDELKNYKDELDSHYKYLSLIYTHTADSQVEKEALAFFYNKIDLLEELKLIQKDSFFSVILNTSPSPLEFRMKEKYQTDPILKQFCDTKSISTQWLWGNISSYGRIDAKFKDHLLFYLQQYIIYKKK